MPAMFKTNERCYKRAFGLSGLEALNHRSELRILCDAFRSQIAELWFPYDRRIANDCRRSQKCVSIWSQTIAELSAICDLQSSAIIWKPWFRHNIRSIMAKINLPKKPLSMVIFWIKVRRSYRDLSSQADPARENSTWSSPYFSY